MSGCVRGCGLPCPSDSTPILGDCRGWCCEPVAAKNRANTYNTCNMLALVSLLRVGTTSIMGINQLVSPRISCGASSAARTGSEDGRHSMRLFMAYAWLGRPLLEPVDGRFQGRSRKVAILLNLLISISPHDVDNFTRSYSVRQKFLSGDKIVDEKNIDRAIERSARRLSRRTANRLRRE